MKKSIILAILGLAVFSAKAQSGLDTKKHEVRVGYSDATPLVLGNLLSDAFIDALFSGSSTDYKTKSFGMIGAGYRYKLADKLQLGADVAFLRANSDITRKNQNMIIRETNYYLVMPTVQYSYVKTPWIDFYGNASAGAIFYAKKETEAQKTTKSDGVGFTFQVNPVGLRVGKEFGGFIEGGYGMKGYATIGASYKF